MDGTHPRYTYMLIGLLSTASVSLAASHRTTNFIVTAPTQALAQEFCETAESCRQELALEWLGHELPRWPEPCPITVQVGAQMGAGGATSFMFDRGRPFGWRMSIQGSRERLLDSVIPHEVTHTIFATHFGRPLPRWADEGACTTVECESEKAKQQHFLVQFLKSKPPRSIPFNKMFRMTEYPHDIMPLYAQGHSVAKFLIAQGGKKKFVDFVSKGLDSENWDHVTDTFYGYRDLSDLQLAWVDWVAKGSQVVPASPAPRNESAVAAATNNRPAYRALGQHQPITVSLASAGRPLEIQQSEYVSANAQGQLVSVPRRQDHAAEQSWYAKQRKIAAVAAEQGVGPIQTARSTARHQRPQQAGHLVLAWE